jgi:hypothetical protein
MTAGGMEIDWALVGVDEARFRELAQAAGANERELKFAAAIRCGATATGAARAAGCVGTHNNIKQQGWKLKQSEQVIALLSLVAAEAGDTSCVSEGDIDRTIARLVHARNNPIANKYGIEAWDRRQERKAAQAAATAQRDPEEILLELAEISPEIAADCAIAHSVEHIVPDKIKAVTAERLEAAAKRWMLSHPIEAVRYLRDAHHVVGAITPDRGVA